MAASPPPPASSPRTPERVLVGVAWPYSNGPQHIGHLAGNLLPADIFARFHRLRGDEVLMVSGSDMHGTPTTVQADAEGVSPEVLSERYHQMNLQSFRQLLLSFDLYTSTHTKTHERTVQQIFLELLEHRYLEKRRGESPYCEKDKRFLPDRYVQGTCPYCGSPSARGDECDACARVLEPRDLKDPYCRTCQGPATFRESEHFYFLLPRLTEKLKAHHASVRDHWRPSVRAFTENYVAAGLQPRPITRDLLWGVPIPLEGYETKRIYVWFEAVIGYLSATQEWAESKGAPEEWRRWWLADQAVRVYQFQGKDNITFHTVIWPAILLAVGGLQLPYDVPANEFMNLSSGKLSKSRSTSTEALPVSLPDLLARYEPEVLRFYVANHLPQNHDTEFVLEDINRDRDQILADQWGNLLQRVHSFVKSNYGNTVPTPPPEWDPTTSAAGERIRHAWTTATREMELVHQKEALEATLHLVRETNRAFHEAKPWAQEEPARTVATYEALWSISAANQLLAPFLPAAAEKVANQLGVPGTVGAGSWDRALVPPVPGTALGFPVPLFPKPLPDRSSPKPRDAEAAMDIRVGKVQGVALHPDADKLLILTIDLGEPETRTIVAGIRQEYSPEELLGKSLAILANLAPRALRGVLSQGMLLAADDHTTVTVLEAPDDTPPGTGLEGTPAHVGMISYDDFQKFRLEIGAGISVKGELLALQIAEDGSRNPLVLTTGYPLRPGRVIAPGAKIR